MSALPEVRGAQPGVAEDPAESAQTHASTAWDPSLTAVSPRSEASERARAALVAVRYPLAVYLLSRVLYLAVAITDTFVRTNVSMLSELLQWDGRWYVLMASDRWRASSAAVGWFPDHIVRHVWTTLGFFPGYPLLVRAAAVVTGLPYAYSGLIVSLITGATATVLVWKLSERWFGHAGARRAIVFFCLFPGSIVFSMDYTEGLLLTLIAGCMLAARERRWLLAGLLAGVSTAVGPVALAIVPALVVAAALELRRRGLTDPVARRAALALLLAPLGLVVFGAYLWRRTGSPFATYIAQHDAWREHSGPLALYFQGEHLVTEFLKISSLRHPGIDLNLVSGLLGAAFMVWAFIYLWRARRRVPVTALVWTLGVAFLTVTSDQVPPNPRMLLCAFPLLLALAAELGPRGYRRLIGASTLMLVVMSMLTFAGSSLRP